MKSLGWGGHPCEEVEWKVGGKSVDGRPIVYTEFGDVHSKNVTLIFSMIHGDEITPLYIGIRLAQWLKENPEATANAHIVLAPLVNPDGFFRSPRTRVNSHGVDINRNFSTSDWSTHALSAWKQKFKSDPRRYPGPTPASEPETIFQQELIKSVSPEKILSVHAPLNFLDYDGPTALSLDKFPEEYVQECLRLRSRLKATTSGYFPGSLGNFAGNERGIPTLTLELPTTDPRKADGYWKKFSQGIRTIIDYAVEPKPVGH